MPLYDPEKRAEKKVVPTADGTPTLYSAEFDECYHSTRDGALKESLHKHILPAFSLAETDKEELVILDVCFGLGYNTLTTLLYFREHPIPGKVKIFSPEFDRELVASLERFEYPEAFKPFRPVIESLARSGRYADEHIEISILFGDARERIPQIPLPVNIVYQDPFSPKKNPLLWTREYFADLRRIASEDLILTTYSSATPVRMGLYENGFLLYEAPGGEVRQGTVASLKPLPLTPIDMELKKERNPAAASLRDRDF
ncbi:tRNA (5-methylaminomethyl-2-thiouridine)(34)-methyltransferase MnmD [Nitratifractor salsuginis]|nr:MnmC family methyltransferase [Nitratifractor salsuginis]